MLPAISLHFQDALNQILQKYFYFSPMLCSIFTVNSVKLMSHHYITLINSKNSRENGRTKKIRITNHFVNTLYILSVVFKGCEAWSFKLREKLD